MNFEAWVVQHGQYSCSFFLNIKLLKYLAWIYLVQALFVVYMYTYQEHDIVYFLGNIIFH